MPVTGFPGEAEKALSILPLFWTHTACRIPLDPQY